MTTLGPNHVVSIVGAGTMGAGIAQVAASAGHIVRLYDRQTETLAQAIDQIGRSLQRRVEKGQIDTGERQAILDRLMPSSSLGDLAPGALIIEAVIEDLEIKRQLFLDLEMVVAADAILASNTSSLSLAAIARDLKRPRRFVGMHFFNPAPLMPLVEVVSWLGGDEAVAATVFETAKRWGKQPVHCRSTPGFIVNRCARPFYAEALRLIAERAADPATIDAVMREAGGFRMGPCELMDLIGHDVNFAVTRAVHAAYFGDPRYQPSLVQQELVEAGHLGRKSGRGFFDYVPGSSAPPPLIAPPAPRPARAVIEGNLGPAEGLMARLERAGIPYMRAEARGPEGAIVLDDAVLRLSDGRTATERGGSAEPNLVLFDLAFDYGQAGHLAAAATDRASKEARLAACGFFQALGFRVSLIDDAPGLIVLRTVAMLANEAFDAVQAGVASPAAIDQAMTMGVNYPKGPLAWADAIGLPYVLAVLDHLARHYGEDRYRASARLRRRTITGRSSHD